MWEYTHTDELCHYGVKGMKWGVRKARSLNVKLLQRKRKADKSKYVRGSIDDLIKPTGDPGGSIQKSKARRNVYKYKDAKTAFLIAKQKAKDDPNYKNSSEYKSAAKELNKQRALSAIRKLLNPTVTSTKSKGNI